MKAAFFEKSFYNAVFTVTLLTLIGYLSGNAFAYQYIVLSDEQLDLVCAKGLSIKINEISAVSSAAASQLNIGVFSALDSDISNSIINNTNSAMVFNKGDSALIAQSNYAFAVSLDGDITGLSINNSNFAEAVNIIDAAGRTAENAVYADNSVSQLNIKTPDMEFIMGSMNDVRDSAAVMQINVAGVAALGGSVRDVVIENINNSVCASSSSSAYVSQNNISVIIARDGIDSCRIHNENISQTGNALLPAGVSASEYMLKNQRIPVEIKVQTFTRNINNRLSSSDLQIRALLKTRGSIYRRIRTQRDFVLSRDFVRGI